MPIADDLELLKKLIKADKVILIPSKDSQYSYLVNYAQEKKAVIVSNDKNLFIKDNPGKSNWIQAHCLTFVFVQNDFIPNPDFKWPSD